MKLDTLKKLFRAKRVIALALAAAMTVTSLPQTAYAAELDAPETETAVEVQEEDEQPAEATEEADNNAEEGDESTPSDENTEESVSGTTQAAEVETVEATGESAAQEEKTTETANQAEGDDTPAADTYTYDNKLAEDAEVKTASYDGYSKSDTFQGENVLGQITVQKNNESQGTLYECQYDFDFKWQTEAGEDKEPVNAGKYQLVVTPRAGGNSLTIKGFTIVPAEVELDLNMASVTPGTEKGKVTDSIKSVTAYAPDDVFRYVPDDENAMLKITEVKVLDPYTNAETADTILKKTGDYLAQVTVDFSDKATAEQKANYKLPQNITKKLNIADLKETKVVLTSVTNATELDDAFGEKVKVISQVYNGNAVSVPTYTAKVEAAPFKDNDNKELHNEIAGAAVTGEWRSVDYFDTWTKEVPVLNEDGTEKKDENGKTVVKEVTYCSLSTGKALNAAPTDAGAYVYRVTYEGDRDLYEESYEDIVVEITPIEVVVKPSGSNTYYAGEKVEDVLLQITYEPIGVENIWGTSYYGVNYTQPYEPVFGVYKIKDDVATRLSKTAILQPEKDVTYEVRFTGKKVARDESGDDALEIDINASVDSFNSNYKTKTDEDTLKANKLTLELSTASLTIDTSAITSAEALNAAGLKDSGYKFDDKPIYTKVYSQDGALYDSRAAYKKAKVEGSGELEYKWYKLRSYTNVEEAYVKVFNGDLDYKDSAKWSSCSVNTNDFDSYVASSLKNAGVYKLKITCDNGAAYGETEIYYAIVPQMLKVLPTNIPAAHYGTRTYNYTEYNHSQFQPKLYMLPNNEGESWTVVEDWTEPDDDYDRWSVQVSTPTKEGETVKWSDWSYAGSFVQETGAEGETVTQNRYRLAYNYSYGSNYRFVKYTIKDVESNNSGNATESSTPKKTCIDEPLSVADITEFKAGSKALTPNWTKAIEATATYDNTSKEKLIDLSGIKYTDAEGKEVIPQFVWRYAEEEYFDADIISPEEAIDAGEYSVYAKYDGDDTYESKSESLVATLTIEKAELTISVKPLTKVVKAGETPYDIFRPYTENQEAGDMISIEGFPAAETEDVINAFTQWKQITNDEYSYPAWVEAYGPSDLYLNEKPELVIYGSDKEKLSDFERLKSGKKYTLTVDKDSLEDNYLAEPYNRNYKFKVGNPVEVTAAYVRSEVSLNTYDFGRDLKLLDNCEVSNDTGKFTHEITFRESVPFTSATVEGKTVYGSYATIKITAPKEFDYVPENAFYKNAMENIEKAGGFDVGQSGNAIYGTFNLSKDSENGLVPNPVTFSIVWKEGYVETFTITPVQDNLAADLRNAVAPRSIAFNAAKTKMVVGEVQDLDVKIVKVQNEDLIYLDYRIADGAPTDVLAITSQGRITALKEGTTTVEVYPVKIVDNKKQQIPGVKTAQAKITVSKVAAPKVGKVIPADESVEIQYPFIINNNDDYGYRREIYIMEGTKNSVEAFNAAIKTFEASGSYKKAGLAVAPVYLSNYEEAVYCVGNAKKATVQYPVDGLTPKTNYTVYVRNVSAQRTVTNKDGSEKTVELSANGVTKDFKTTLGQVKKLELSAVLDERSEVRAAEIDGYKSVKYYEYNLEKGSAQLSVTGWFSAIEDGIDQAEKPDYSKAYPIPFSDKTLKTKLLEPKLEYCMYQLSENVDGSWEYIYDYSYDETYGWYSKERTAQYTSADKRGILKFTQPEAIAVIVRDTVTGAESDEIIIRIKADADSATARKVTLQVGQETPIVDLVAYKAGKAALDSSSPYFAHEATATGNSYFKVENGTITPVIYDKATARQTVTVTNIEGPSVTGGVAITIRDLAPVTKLKFDNLIDNSAVLNFTPSIYAEGYIVEVRNSVGNLIQRRYISQYVNHVEHCDCDICEYNDGFIWYYSASKKAYVLLDEYKDRFVISGLTAKSKYNVSVTAVYGDAESKKVSTSITTTKIPAWDKAWNESDNYDEDTQTGGMPIKVFVSQGSGSDYNTAYVSSRKWFVSGNAYTLVADANAGAQYAVTDRLTWTISDSKVAKISAIGGTYSASLKALKAGTATIEVKSGILKKTIARWTITVYPVGDAYNDMYFYDENDNLRGEPVDKYDTTDIQMLNVSMQVEPVAKESKTFADKTSIKQITERILSLIANR